jgi:hypothetical protein
MSRIKPNHSAPSGPATKLVKTEARVPTGVGMGNSVNVYRVAVPAEAKSKIIASSERRRVSVNPTFSNFDGEHHYFLFWMLESIYFYIHGNNWYEYGGPQPIDRHLS